jgi:uroporphyrinogen-III synthase
MPPPLALAGLRVLLTRPEGPGMDEWAAALTSAGAMPVPYPTTVTVPPVSWGEVDAALARLDEYGWLVFTSRTAVVLICDRLPGGRFPANLRAKIAAVGTKTAEAIQHAGGRLALVPSDERQEGLVHDLAQVPPETRILLPMAAGGRTLLAEKLRARGCRVDVIPVYRTLPKAHLPPPPTFDVATFASPSALRAFLAGLGTASLASKVVVVIGTTTAAEATASGLDPLVADSPSVDGLIRAIANRRTSKGDA